MSYVLQQGRFTLKPTKMPDTDEAKFSCKFKSEGSLKTLDAVLYAQRMYGNVVIVLDSPLNNLRSILIVNLVIRKRLICPGKIIILPGQDNYTLICPCKITAD